ncbi:MAG: hypothetical protein Q4F65_12980 [Propionibacteriaceae bacterium]|nr:hypothetical protein [Propionibacteriaceae bacterium]
MTEPAIERKISDATHAQVGYSFLAIGALAVGVLTAGPWRVAALALAAYFLTQSSYERGRKETWMHLRRTLARLQRPGF